MHSSPRLFRLCTLLHVERVALASAKNSGALLNETYVSPGLRETYLRYCISTRRPYLEVDKTALTITLNTSPLNGLVPPGSSSTSSSSSSTKTSTTTDLKKDKVEEDGGKGTTIAKVEDEFAFVRTFLDQLNRDIVKSPRHLKLGLQISSASGRQRQENLLLPGPREGSNESKEKEKELSINTTSLPVLKDQGVGKSGNGAFTIYTSSKGHAREICTKIFAAYKTLILSTNNRSGFTSGIVKKEGALSVLARRRAVKVRKLKKVMADPTAKLRRRLPFDASAVVF